MSHDKIKAAARRRMAETGEPYSVARRAVMNEHKQATEHAADANSMASHPSGAELAALENFNRFSEQFARMPQLNFPAPDVVEKLNRAAEQFARFASFPGVTWE